MDDKLIPLLWRAFPKKWFTKTGTKARCGATLVSIPGGTAWVLSEKLTGGPARLAIADLAAGDPTVRQLADGLMLLPDLDDPVTVTMIRNLLAMRAGVDTDHGVLWVPKAKGKTMIGWEIQSWTKSKQISSDLVTSRDPIESMIQAVAASNCACMHVDRKQCPEHGSPGVWR